MKLDTTLADTWMMEPGQSRLERHGQPLVEQQSGESNSRLGESREDGQVSFKRLYDETVRANRRAGAAQQSERFEAREAKRSVGTQRRLSQSESGGGAQRVEDVDIEAATTDSRLAHLQQGVVEDVSAQGSEDEGAEEATSTRETAATILAGALEQVSQLLGLNLVDEISKVTLMQPQDAELSDLAEIVDALQGITGLMDEAVRQNVALDIGAMVLEPQQMAAMEKTIHHELFRVQWALSMMGVSSEVSARVAQKHEGGFDGGIPQALDPASKQMPVGQLQKLFAAPIQEQQQEIDTLVKKLAKLLGGQEGSAGAVQLQASKPLVRPQSELAGLERMETPVARTLLKIDSEELTTIENTMAAAGTDKMDLPKPNTLVLGRSLGQDMGQQLSSQQQPQSPLPTEGVGRTGGEQPLVHANPSRMLERLEESVMGQLSTRLNAALKAGAAAHEVKIMLRPEALGQVQLRVQMEGEKVITQIRVENQQVKQIIENNLQALKSALAEHNLQTGSFSVDVDAGSWQQARQQPTTGNFGSSGGSDGPSGEDDGERSVDTAAPQPIRGQDTGRRYGDNSLEFYA